CNREQVEAAQLGVELVHERLECLRSKSGASARAARPAATSKPGDPGCAEIVQTDHVEAPMSSARFGSLLVALDDLGRSELGSLGVLAGVAARAPLPQEIPALVERYPQLLQPQPVGVGCLTRR